MLVCLLQVEWDGIVNPGVDVGLLEMSDQSLLVFDTNYIKVIDRARPGRFERRNYVLCIGEQTIVFGSAFAALLIPLGQVS